MPEKYRPLKYPFIAHGCGAADEFPVVVARGHHKGGPGGGMVISIEGYMGTLGGSTGVKYEDQIIVTDGPPEVLSFAPAETKLPAHRLGHRTCLWCCCGCSLRC